MVPEEILICGDFNFKVNRSDYHEAIQFLEYLNSLDLIQCVIEPAHILGNTLDLVITRNSNALIENVKVDTQISDHTNILCDFHLKKPPVPKKEIVLRKLNSLDIKEFMHDIRNKVCGIQLESSCAAMVKAYNSVLRELLDKHAPEQHRIVYLRPNVPWMTEN